MSALARKFVLELLVFGVAFAMTMPVVAGEEQGVQDVAEEEAQAEEVPAVYPAAIFAFEERGSGVRGYGRKVSDLLFASLIVDPNLFLVDREDMQKTLDELELSLSGAVSPDHATQVGQLTGARVLVTGSVIEVDRSIYLVARIIGTETSRMLGASVRGLARDELAPLVEELGAKVAETIHQQADKLVAAEEKTEDRIAGLRKQLGDAERLVVAVDVEEWHVGEVVIDPAAETELILFLRETGFDVLEETAGRQNADIILKGEGFSEFAMQRGNLVSVKARLEVKAVNRRTDEVITIDRQTTVAVDLTEMIAGKTALQKAAADIAERMLPKLVE